MQDREREADDRDMTTDAINRLLEVQDPIDGRTLGDRHPVGCAVAVVLAALAPFAWYVIVRLDYLGGLPS